MGYELEEKRIKARQQLKSKDTDPYALRASLGVLLGGVGTNEGEGLKNSLTTVNTFIAEKEAAEAAEAAAEAAAKKAKNKKGNFGKIGTQVLGAVSGATNFALNLASPIGLLGTFTGNKQLIGITDKMENVVTRNTAKLAGVNANFNSNFLRGAAAGNAAGQVATTIAAGVVTGGLGAGVGAAVGAGTAAASSIAAQQAQSKGKLSKEGWINAGIAAASSLASSGISAKVNTLGASLGTGTIADIERGAISGGISGGITGAAQTGYAAYSNGDDLKKGILKGLYQGSTQGAVSGAMSAGISSLQRELNATSPEYQKVQGSERIVQQGKKDLLQFSTYENIGNIDRYGALQSYGGSAALSMLQGRLQGKKGIDLLPSALSGVGATFTSRLEQDKLVGDRQEVFTGFAEKEAPKRRAVVKTETPGTKGTTATTTTTTTTTTGGTQGTQGEVVDNRPNKYMMDRWNNWVDDKIGYVAGLYNDFTTGKEGDSTGMKVVRGTVAFGGEVLKNYGKIMNPIGEAIDTAFGLGDKAAVESGIRTQAEQDAINRDTGGIVNIAKGTMSVASIGHKIQYDKGMENLRQEKLEQMEVDNRYSNLSDVEKGRLANTQAKADAKIVAQDTAKIKLNSNGYIGNGGELTVGEMPKAGVNLKDVSASYTGGLTAFIPSAISTAASTFSNTTKRTEYTPGTNPVPSTHTSSDTLYSTQGNNLKIANTNSRSNFNSVTPEFEDIKGRNGVNVGEYYNNINYGNTQDNGYSLQLDSGIDSTLLALQHQNKKKNAVQTGRYNWSKGYNAQDSFRLLMSGI